MTKESELKPTREPATSIDPPALRLQAEVYAGLAEEDVLAVAGDVVPEVIEISERLATTIEAGIGTAASSGTVGVTTLEVAPYEREILDRARRAFAKDQPAAAE